MLNHRKTSQTPTTPVPFDLVREKKRVFETFPHMVNRLFYIDLHTVNIHDVDIIPPEIVYDYKTRKTSACYRPPLYPDLFFILFSTKNNEKFLGKDIDKDAQLYFIFDHETAHAIVKDGFTNTQKSESIADAYGLIRHYQRYGLHSHFGHHLMFRRAGSALFSQSDNKTKMKHFTSPVIEYIVQNRHTLKLDTLTPTETVDLAHRLGTQYAIDMNDLKSIKKDFQKISKHVKNVQEKSAKAEKTVTSIPNALSKKWATFVLRKARHQTISKETKNICFQELQKERADKSLIKDLFKKY